MTSRESHLETAHATIIDAALICLREYGLSKTAMADVARIAGVSRRTVYRNFGSRHELFGAVVLTRSSKHFAYLQTLLRDADRFSDALVLATMESLKRLREDDVLMAAIEGASELGIEHYFVDPDSVLHKKTLELLQGIFGAARQRGELREDISDDEIVSLMGAAALLLWSRGDLPTPQQENLIRRVLLPCLLPPARGLFRP